MEDVAKPEDNSPPRPEYPIHGGCVYCTYLSEGLSSASRLPLVSPAEFRVLTPNGWRDLCSFHAADVSSGKEIQW